MATRGVMKHVRKLFSRNPENVVSVSNVEQLEHCQIYGCDMCGQVISREFYRCWTCEDFLLCVDCWGKHDAHNHAFIFMPEGNTW